MVGNYVKLSGNPWISFISHKHTYFSYFSYLPCDHAVVALRISPSISPINIEVVIYDVSSISIYQYDIM